MDINVYPNELKKTFRIAVIGAGVSGFSSATCIQKYIPNCDVTIIAENSTPDITSEAAAGLIELHAVDGNTKETLQKWLKATLMRVSKLFYRSNGVEKSGISALSGYYLSLKDDDKDLVPRVTLDMLPNWHNLSAEEMSLFPEYKSGIFMTTMIAESALYVRWMRENFEQNGGKFIKKKIFSFKEIADEYDAIINCSGLGAIDLVNDDSLKPIKGHVLKVQAPWVKHFIVHENEESVTYIIPGSSGVILGGIFEVNNWDTNVNIIDSEDIFKRCCSLLPSLRKAKIMQEMIGWRPYRSKGVRLETETIPMEGKSVFCVHNYGHGGAGVSLSWGCALDVTDHIKSYINNTQSKL